MKFFVLMVTLSVTYSQACHLAVPCRKKRAVNAVSNPNLSTDSIHGGCLPSRDLTKRESAQLNFLNYEFIASKDTILRLLMKVGLRNKEVNSRLTECAQKRGARSSYDPDQTFSSKILTRYYMIYRKKKNGRTCYNHPRTCEALRECLDLLKTNETVENIFLQDFKQQSTVKLNN